jgi:hypothetical protein
MRFVDRVIGNRWPSSSTSQTSTALSLQQRQPNSNSKNGHSEGACACTGTGHVPGFAGDEFALGIWPLRNDFGEERADVLREEAEAERD